MDALAYEPQFVAHAAPIWQALPERGRFLVEPSLVEYARSRGIEAEPRARLNVNRGGQIRPNTADRPCLVASYGDIKEARRFGYGPLAFVEHGIGQGYQGDPRSPQARNGSYAGGKDREDVELFLVPNETCAAMWRDAYPKARVETVGLVKTLPARVPDGQTTVGLSFHFNASRIAPEAGTAIGTFGPVIGALAKRFHVIGHEHPRWRMEGRSLERQYRRWGIEYVPDFEDVCRRASVYVCDNSSTIYEFASTGRPVVVMNDRAYRRSVEHGLRFWTAADVGVQVDVPAMLGDAVEDALADAPARKVARDAALDIVYQPRSGGAKLAAAAITDWLASREVAAA